MPKSSAGLLPFRRRDGTVEVLLVHPGGPFWSNKDRHAWSIPKGECAPGEDLLACARREVAEETGLRLEGQFLPLPACRQASGKTVQAWAIEADCDPALLRSNDFTIEWPPRSRRMASFPEIDRAAWFALAESRDKIHKGQIPLLDALAARLGQP